MRKTDYRPYIALFLFLFMVMSLPTHSVQKMRSLTVVSLAPSWQALHCVKQMLLTAATSVPTHGGKVRLADTSQEMDRLRQENQLLRSQLENIKEWLLFEDRIGEQLERLKTLSECKEGDLFWKEFFRRRSEHLAGRLELELQALPAKVIFREPSSWSSTLWLNVGERDNEALGRSVVAKNSPVLWGTAVVGIVDYVGKNECRLRLITDPSIVPSVRAVREHYLAKGELHGSGNPLWRSRGQLLKGIGFNYDFADEEGSARDLRTGEAEGMPTEPLLKVGDLLVTSGLDGVFPPGFEVASITSISSLREGACVYELEAKPSAGNLDELTHVTILPPLEIKAKID